MSMDGIELSFESFLHKRKDTMKTWVAYWFRLQNTTLFFYSKKNGNASHLRGSYYIYTVQSVREIQRADSKRFMFELVMANGKRKLLAAETAALRQEWINTLWQAMHLSSSRRFSDCRGTRIVVPEQPAGMSSSAPTSSRSDPVMEWLPVQPLAASTGHIHHETGSISSAIDPSEELNSDRLKSLQRAPGLSSANADEGDYDVLPVRTKVCETGASKEMDESLYDFPLSFRRAAEHPETTENIYDVPSALLRTLSDQA